jgi:hypothetical protein
MDLIGKSLGGFDEFKSAFPTVARGAHPFTFVFSISSSTSFAPSA